MFLFLLFCERAMSSPEKEHLKITIIIIIIRERLLVLSLVITLCNFKSTWLVLFSRNEKCKWTEHFAQSSIGFDYSSHYLFLAANHMFITTSTS